MNTNDASSLLRKDLPPELIQLVDSRLKSLRSSSRKLHSLTSVLDTEVRVLDRLYYKSSSQHRSALFWKRACEIRRLSRRTYDAKPGEVIDACRASFFGTSQNIKRVAWTQLPNASEVAEILRCLSTFGQLIVEAVQRYRKAYQWFIAQLRTTAFAPLVTLLVAAVSRLHAVATEIGTELVTCWNTVDAIYSNIPVPPGSRSKPSTRLPAGFSQALLLDGSESTVGRPKYVVNPSSSFTAVGEGDDLGQTVLRNTAPLQVGTKTSNSTSLSVSHVLSSSTSTTPPQGMASETPGSNVAAASMPRVDTSSAPVKSVKKTRRKLHMTGGDEIDTIFGDF